VKALMLIEIKNEFDVIRVRLRGGQLDCGIVESMRKLSVKDEI
jgi:hypothetical protein